MKESKLWIRLLIVPILLGITGACTNYSFDPDKDQNVNDEQLSECNTLDPTFEKEILSVLQDHCIACHNSNAPTAGYDYSEYDKVISSALDGSLLGTIEHQDGYSPMPPSYKLSDCNTSMIKVWMLSEGIDTIPVSDTIIITEESDCDPDTVYFENSVLPLVVSSCATTNCHDAASHKDGIILTDYTSIRTTGEIKPGDPNDSEFFETLTDNGDDRMPPLPYARLDSDQIELLRKWILQGAKNNSCSEGCDPSGATFTNDVWPLMQTYCTGCHSDANPGGGIVLSGYNDLVALANNGSLMGSVKYEAGYSAMPTNQQLSDCQISVLQDWIDNSFPQ
jgi:mono/diheme cytochrome c family protein